MSGGPAPRVSSPLGEPLVDARAVAAFLGIHVASVYRLAGRSGGLPVVQVGPGVRRFRPADVRAYVERLTRTPQVRSGRAEILLGALPAPRQNELAPSPRQSVHRKQESSAGSTPRTSEAGR